ncbi:diguanylate cyclase [Butyrivibrio sp. CB08]|uniref:histidine kinase N-terminal 7TM domain-containing diguanylate cyclase n=1 Tax=Butyrivibrio sp. CB08 TaxID=2364879 RepID=UPI000EA8D9D3|nr:diguanylate cyclase [Butyrivibrio sp. CB08]RKM62223.1 diguanylate cyclase [Butyrivibrio sp. CB08]
MYYAYISALAFVLNLILNREPIWNVMALRKEKDESRDAELRYGYFLIAAAIYYIVDCIWGVLDAYHTVPGLYPAFYTSTALYFLMMLVTLLAWTRYIVAYLNRRGRRSKRLLMSVRILFIVGVVVLFTNGFFPTIFYFDESNKYIPGPGRHILFLLQIVLYLVISIYMFYNANRSIRSEKVRYIAVGASSSTLGLLLICQILYVSFPFYASGLIIASSVIHSFVEASEKREKQIYDHILTVMAQDYEAIYYVDIESGEFLEFAISKRYADLNVPCLGKDFYGETQQNIELYVHPEDREIARNFYRKEIILQSLEGRKSFAIKYRLILQGESRYFLFTLMRANDGKHFILYEKDIQEELNAEKARLETQQKSITFGRIAETLASNYDVIFYVDIEDNSYVKYGLLNGYTNLEDTEQGEDFFADTIRDVDTVVHKQDRDVVRAFVDKDRLLADLAKQKRCSLDHRILLMGKLRYARMSVRKTSDGSHLIVGLENIDAEIKREKQYLKTLKSEKELARKDELTGTKNKTAYTELENSVQDNIDNGVDYLPFGLVVCDANDLKNINDTLGHAAGDEYIKATAKILCEIFDHSPVFRIGGDEFVVFLRGGDYSHRYELMGRLRDRVHENQKSDTGPVIASGMAEFDSNNDSMVSDVFDRADKDMYENKQYLKSIG